MIILFPFPFFFLFLIVFHLWLLTSFGRQSKKPRILNKLMIQEPAVTSETNSWKINYWNGIFEEQEQNYEADNPKKRRKRFRVEGKLSHKGTWDEFLFCFAFEHKIFYGWKIYDSLHVHISYKALNRIRSDVTEALSIFGFWQCWSCILNFTFNWTSHLSHELLSFQFEIDYVNRRSNWNLNLRKKNQVHGNFINSCDIWFDFDTIIASTKLLIQHV